MKFDNHANKTLAYPSNKSLRVNGKGSESKFALAFICPLIRILINHRHTIVFLSYAREGISPAVQAFCIYFSRFKFGYWSNHVASYGDANERGYRVRNPLKIESASNGIEPSDQLKNLFINDVLLSFKVIECGFSSSSIKCRTSLSNLSF